MRRRTLDSTVRLSFSLADLNGLAGRLRLVVLGRDGYLRLVAIGLAGRLRLVALGLALSLTRSLFPRCGRLPAAASTPRAAPRALFRRRRAIASDCAVTIRRVLRIVELVDLVEIHRYVAVNELVGDLGLLDLRCPAVGCGRGLAPRRCTCRLLGLALECDRPLTLVSGERKRGKRLSIEDASDRYGRLLADERGSLSDEHVEAVDLACACSGVVATEFTELELDRRPLCERRRRLEVDELALGQEVEMIGVGMSLSGDEEEPAPGCLLDCRKPRTAGADDELQHARMQSDTVGLHPVPGGGKRAKSPLDLHCDGVIRDDDAIAGAGGALAGEDLTRAVSDVLPRHLDESERGNLDDVRLGPVSLELFAQRILDRGAVLRVRHVDEVDHDDPADIPEAELPHDLLDRLEVVLCDRVFESLRRVLRTRSDEPSGVDVDHRERLGIVEDEIAARGKIDAPVEGRGDLLLDAGALEQRLLLLVAMDALDHVRRGLLEIADDALVGALVVDLRRHEVAGEEIPHDPQRQLGLLVDKGRRGARRRSRLDCLPEPLQENEVALDVLC